MNHRRALLSYPRRLAGFIMALALCLLALGATPRPVHAQAGVCGDSNDWPPNCGCGSYVALKLFERKVALGSWPHAYTLANQAYWNAGYVQYNRDNPANLCGRSAPYPQSWRYRNDVPQTGDVLIMQNQSRFWLKNGEPGAAPSAGHAGFVLAPAYNPNKTLNGDSRRYAGWDLTVRSANWGCYDRAASQATYVDSTMRSNIRCQNVSEVPIFVPNDGGVSFWREVKRPNFYTILPVNQPKTRALAPSADPKAAAVVQAMRDARDEAQIWVIEILPEKDPVASVPWFRIINYTTGKCLDVSGGSTNNGAPILTWPCHNGDNQKWRVTTIRGPLGIRSKATGKLLDVPGGTQAAGAQIIQWEANGGSNQQWLLEPVTPPGCPPGS